jgi:hypothetical protein
MVVKYNCFLDAAALLRANMGGRFGFRTNAMTATALQESHYRSRHIGVKGLNLSTCKLRHRGIDVLMSSPLDIKPNEKPGLKRGLVIPL